jgi:hypothetical protein
MKLVQLQYVRRRSSRSTTYLITGLKTIQSTEVRLLAWWCQHERLPTSYEVRPISHHPGIEPCPREASPLQDAWIRTAGRVLNPTQMMTSYSWRAFSRNTHVPCRLNILFFTERVLSSLPTDYNYNNLSSYIVLGAVLSLIIQNFLTCKI